MKKQQLLMVAVLLALGSLSWVYWKSVAAFDSLQDASTRLEECQDLVGEIEFLRDRNAMAVTVAPFGFDPLSVVRQAATDANFPTDTDSYVVTQATRSVIEGTGVRQWSVDIPSSNITLVQVIAMIRNLADSDMHYQVNSVRLTEASKGKGASEIWKSEFDISFLKEDHR